jgi:hypothetical protein
MPFWQLEFPPGMQELPSAAHVSPGFWQSAPLEQRVRQAVAFAQARPPGQSLVVVPLPATQLAESEAQAMPEDSLPALHEPAPHVCPPVHAQLLEA